MNARSITRGLATGAMVALAVVSFQVAPAHAAKKNPQSKTASQCVAQGYQWDDVKGCADKECDNPEARGYHGDWYFGLKHVYICDGYTGNWVQWRTNDNSPTNPQAPRPTTNGRT